MNVEEFNARCNAALNTVPVQFQAVIESMAYDRGHSAGMDDDRGHSAGMDEVACILEGLVKELKPSIEAYAKAIKEELRG